eukprot:scaffold12.g8101.t1
MSELAEYVHALDSRRPAVAHQQQPRTPVTPASPAADSGSACGAATPGDSAWAPPPSHLLRLPAVREAALLCLEASRDASRSPQDFQLAYKYALSLQELASKVGDAPADQLTLLQQACSVYCVASELPACPGAPAATALLHYNWAVALSDCARIVRPQQPDEARELLSAAAGKYARSLEANPFNPQALNNWGLVLVDLSSLRPGGGGGPRGAAAAQAAYAAHAVAKFRRAVRLRPDFERAVYNLGTVAYAQACTQQEDLLSSGSGGAAEAPGPHAGGGGASPRTSAAHASTAERLLKASFAHAAQYIALAYAMQPSKVVYANSLAAVQRLLPLPHLRAGPLLAPAAADGPEEHWVAAWFALDGGGLRAVRPPAVEAGGGGSPATTPPLGLAWPLGSITDARACADPSLPRGAGLWLGLAGRTAGVFLVAERQEDAEGWADAILLLRHLHSQGRLEGLQQALTSAPGRAGGAAHRPQQQQQQ